MTNISPSEIDEYLKTNFPTIYKDHGAEVILDFGHLCTCFYSDKYIIEWGWKTKWMSIRTMTTNGGNAVFEARIGGKLDLLCELDDEGKRIMYCSAESINHFCERLLSIGAFQ